MCFYNLKIGHGSVNMENTFVACCVDSTLKTIKYFSLRSFYNKILNLQNTLFKNHTISFNFTSQFIAKLCFTNTNGFPMVVVTFQQFNYLMY